jgi:hypothetical protein
MAHSLVSLFPCLLIYLSTNKNTPPPAICQGRGVDPRGTTLLEPESGSALPMRKLPTSYALITVASPRQATTVQRANEPTFNGFTARLPGPFVGVVAASFTPWEAL